jgi:hypothetical protein
MLREREREREKGAREEEESEFETRWGKTFPLLLFASSFSSWIKKTRPAARLTLTLLCSGFKFRYCRRISRRCKGKKEDKGEGRRGRE